MPGPFTVSDPPPPTDPSVTVAAPPPALLLKVRVAGPFTVVTPKVSE